MVLRDPTVDVAVLETARGGIVRAGLGYRYCDVGAVLNVTADHLGLGGVDTLERARRGQALVVEVAQGLRRAQRRRPAAWLKMAAATEARRHRSTSPCNPEHRAGARAHPRRGSAARGARAGARTATMIVIYDGEQQIPLLWTHLIPATLEGKALHNVENAMFAAAMAYALGVTLDNIRTGPAHLRQHLLPVARPDERLRRARLPGDPRLRPQRPRHGGDGADDPRA